MRPWFFVNPQAGRVRYEEVVDALRRTHAPDGASVSSTLPMPEKTPCLIAAVGGDGTVSRVINAYDLENLWLGIIPRGSANDLAAELRIPVDLDAACALMRQGPYEQIDVIEVNGVRLATCGGLGLANDVAELAQRWKERQGLLGRTARRLRALVYPLATVVQVLHQSRPIRATVYIEDERSDLDLSMVIVSNQPRFGGRFCASPSASNRDGLVHLALVRAPGSRLRLLWICLQIFRGAADRCPEVTSLRTRSLTIETDRPITFFGDGEPLATGREFRVRALPLALRVASGRGAIRA